MLIDAHNHLQDPRIDSTRETIVEQMQLSGISACVVNGTEAADWPKVAALAECYPRFVLPSFGLHPWKVGDRHQSGGAGKWLIELESLLQKFPTAGVGEIGLDRWIEGHDIEDQQEVFAAQLRLAANHDRPCTVHCLRAWGPLLQVLESANRLPRILVHSFGGSIETGRRLAKLGVWFSFSGYFLHPRKEKVVEVFKQLPVDRILVETDAPDMLPPESDRPFGGSELNHPANLARIEQRLSELVGISPEQLIANTRDWWGDLPNNDSYPMPD